MDLRLAGPATGAWLVTLGCLGEPAAAAAVVAVVALGGLLLVVVDRRPASAALALVLLGVLAGAVATGARVWSRDTSPLAALADHGAAATIALVVTGDPRPVGRRSAFGPPPIALEARAVEVTAAGRTFAVGGRLLVLATDQHWRRLLPSQRLTASGRLASPRGGDLTVAVLSARGPPIGVGAPSLLQRMAGGLRSGLRSACSGLPAKERGLLPGLVIGDTTGLDPALGDDFRTTGLTHLVAVSGTNCAIICGAVLLLARRLRAGPRAAAVLAGLALVGFVVLARPSPSVLRAAVMGALALLGLATGRARAALPGLCAAVLMLVLVDPSLARSAGFALSVLATAGLLVLAPGWREALRRRGWPAGLAEALALPAAAQVACAPVIAAISGRVGIVAVPANLLAIPAVAPATLLGVGATLLSQIWPAAAAVLARLAGLPTAWLVTVAEHGARVRGGSVGWPAGATGGLLLTGLLGAALLAARQPSVRRAALCASCVFTLVAVPVGAVAPGWPPAGWVLVVCDVGQGDALVLNAGPHVAVVVDTGPDPVSADRCLRRLGVRQVPLLILTHLHVDHAGGLAGVLRGRAVAALEVGPSHEPAYAWADVERQAKSAGIALLRSQVGERRTVGAVHLQVLAPFAAFHGTRSDPNNDSIVLRVGVAGHTLLLAGDAEVAAQDALLATGADLRAEVLKVPHHGSAYGDPRFFAQVRPAVALVSVGAGNPYGHPSAPLLARLARMGALTERTDRDGDLAVAVRAGRLYTVTTGSHATGSGGVRRAAARSPPRRPQAPQAPATPGVGSRMVASRPRCSCNDGSMPSDALAPLQLVTGDEELLVARAVAKVFSAARAADPDAELIDLGAAEASAGGLAELLSPSLFGGRRVVVLRDSQDLAKDVGAALLAHAADLAPDMTLVVTHQGGAKGKALAEGLTKAGALVVLCAKPRRPSERLSFVREEVRAAGGSIEEPAAQALLDAVGTDLRELSSACAQLVGDTGGAIDAAAVARCHRGRAEVTGFAVADNALVGDVAGALSSLRWALSLGVDPVPIADAIADGIRTVSRVASVRPANGYAVAAALKMPLWKVERAQRQARGWSAEGLGRAMGVAADLNAGVKGVAGDTRYALERAVLAIAAERVQP